MRVGRSIRRRASSPTCCCARRISIGGSRATPSLFETLGSGRQIDTQRLQSQFRELEDALDQAGVKRHYLEPEPHLPYQVYTRDSSQTTPWGPAPDATRASRQAGRNRLRSAVSRAGDGFWRYCSRGNIEGGDIHIIRPGLIVVGWSGVRTVRDGAMQFAGWFEEAGWEARLQSFAEHFLHLDVLFCMAAEGLAVACIEALGDPFADWLKAHGIRVVEATYREVMAMSCNLLSLGGDRVISPRHSRSHQRGAARRGPQGLRSRTRPLRRRRRQRALHDHAAEARAGPSERSASLPSASWLKSRLPWTAIVRAVCMIAWQDCAMAGQRRIEWAQTV